VAQYTRNKGECEDLDEGKLSFLLVHYWNMRPSNIQVREILRQGRDQGKLSAAQKEIILDEFKRSGVMALTKEKLQTYEIKLGEFLDDLELTAGQENWTLRLLLLKLSIGSCR
jgi:fusicocca-2,10(14)-diene synthase/ophiobolin F synthase